MESCEVAILGGGCAGLSLARELLERAYPKRVLIIEPRAEYEHDRTWCFWSRAAHSQTDLVSKEWQRWCISSGDQVIEHTSLRRSYQQIRSGDFYESNLKALSQSPNIELRQGVAASKVTDNGHEVVVETDMGRLSAALVIDTRPRPPESDTATLWQVFSGAEIETESPSFDPAMAGLMQDMSSDASGLRFTYVLPMTRYRALVQTTRFSLIKLRPETLDQEFDSDLRALVSGPFVKIRNERGCLPMGQTKHSSSTSSSIVRAGQAAGALRASSGYGYLRIQDWAERTAIELSNGRVSFSTRYDSRLERRMDAIFLAALAKSPHAAAGWFATIAEHLSGDEFARFMSEKPSLGLWRKVISALPKTPFLRALIASLPLIGSADQKVLA